MIANSTVENLNQQIASLLKENELLKQQLLINNIDINNSTLNEVFVRQSLTQLSQSIHTNEVINDLNLHLNKSENWFKSIFDNALVGIVFKDINGNVLLVNNAFEKMLGYTSTDIKGKNIESFTHKNDLNKEREILHKTLNESKEYYHFEKRYIHKNNLIVWAEISVSIIRNSEASPIYLVSIINDITEKKVNEESLLKALEFNEKINQTSPVGIVKCDESGSVVFANQKAIEVLGLHKKDLTQRAYNSPEWEITDFTGNHLPIENLPFSIVRKTGNSVYDIQHAIKWPNGKIIFLSINACPQFDNYGEFSGMIATVEDISKRVLAERELNENLQFRNSIIRNAAEGLCVWYNCNEFPYVKFTIWNDQMTIITGYTIDEINKSGWYQSLYHDIEIQNKAIQRIKEMRIGVDIIGDEWEIRTKYGEDKIVSISTSIIKSEADKTYVMALITDVTEKNKHLVTIEQQNKTLLELNATKNKFFSIISHDLRGPVGQFYSISELLYTERKEMEESQVDFFLKSMMDSSAKLQLLLNDLLNWSKSQMSKLELSPQTVKTFDIFNETIYILEDTIKAKEINIEIFHHDLSVIADVNSIKTVLRNLLFNAIKFSYRAGKVKLISTLGPANQVIIAISDQGVGIPKDRLETLFQIEKLDSTAGTENEMGTGLGLSICKEFIEKNNGEIWIESEVGKGSTFYFSLPCGIHPEI